MKLFYLLLLLVAHCTVFGQTTLPRVLIDPDDQPKGPLMMNDMVESVAYIPLETRKNVLIGDRITYFDISTNYIALYCSKSKQAYLFRRNGSFVCLIGRTGLGPGEYTTLSSLFIEEDKKQILIIDNYRKSLFTYNLNGKYMHSTPIPGEIDGGAFSRLHNNFFYYVRFYSVSDQPFVYDVYTREMKRARQAVNTVPIERTSNTINFSAPPNNYLYNDRIHVRESALNDTLYAINPNLSFTPKYLIDAGKRKMTSEFMATGDANTYMANIQNYIRCHHVFETKSRLLLAYFYGRTSTRDDLIHYAYYNKADRKLLYFASNQGIPNDYDGGISFWPQRQDENYYYTFYPAHLFEERLDTQKKLTPKGSKEAVQSFNRMYQKLDPEDNPVLVIVKLKE